MASVSVATLQAAYLLHHRPFRDTSVIADLITPDFGKISVIARGVRSAKSRRRALLQPFRPLLASWTGRAELKTLTTLEESGQPHALTGESLACAYYVTELSLRLLPTGEPNIEAFALYDRTLAGLAASCAGDYEGESQDNEIYLRLFELELLDCLGVLPDFAQSDIEHGQIEADRDYHFQAESAQATRSAAALNSIAVSGTTLLALAARDFTNASVLSESKLLMRHILQQHLGNQPLKSREVFRQLKKKTTR